MTFAELPIGAKFRFFSRGMLLTKASKDTYTALKGHAQKADPDAEVLPEEDPAPTERPATPKPDDAALVSKTLDDLRLKPAKRRNWRPPGRRCAGCLRRLG